VSRGRSEGEQSSRPDGEEAPWPDGGEAPRPDGGVGRPDVAGFRAALDLEELRRRNPRAVAMDLLYLFTTAFFGHLLVQGIWPAVIAAAPLGLMLYFGWNSSRAFFLAQVLVIAATVAASGAGAVPL
jgi:hypothetical protein